MGPIYDTNAQRIDQTPGSTIVGDAALRLTIQGDGGYASDNRKHLVTANYTGGVKYFLQLRSEDTFTNAADIAYAYVASDTVAIGAMAQLRDSTQRENDRDYTFAATGGYVDWRVSDAVVVRGTGGYQRFYYYPVQRYSYQAATGGVQVRARLPKDFSIAGSYDFSARFFDSAALRFEFRDDVTGDSFFTPLGYNRFDTLHDGGLGLTWNGVVLTSLSYHLLYNASNSDSESYLRHRVQLTLTAELPWRLVFFLRGQIQISTYSQKSVVSGQTALADDDENQSAIVAVLSRPVFEKGSVMIALDLTYGFYHSELTSAVNRFPYDRHVVSFGVAVVWASTRRGDKP